MSLRRDRDVLTAAIDSFDLSRYIHERWPESGVKPGQSGLYFACWRGNDQTPAFSLSRTRERWLWKDHATGEGGNAFTFMTQVEGLDNQEAAHLLIEAAGLAPQEPASGRQTRSDEGSGPRYHPLPREAVQALAKRELGTVAAMKGRGFTKAMMQTYGIRADGQDALIPITSPDGVVMQVKRRLAKPGKQGKYRYEHKGHGGPPWCSSNLRQAPTLLIVEGELNAIVAHAALVEAGEHGVGVMGVAGAQSPLYPGACAGKRVLVYADDDEAGAIARSAWAQAAHEAGAESVRTIPPHEMDFCDFAGRHGLGPLAQMLDAMRHASEQVYGATDRMLGTLTISEIIERNDRYLDGGVLNATGFPEFDRETGGIRESGIYAIGGLSSMGKSSVMRYMLLNHVRDGGMVKVYSPDQAPIPFYRLTAALLSGVGAKEVRTRNYSKESLRLWGTPEAADKAYRDTFAHVLTEIAPRIKVSEEARVAAIVKDMERAVDEGVTMFGIDYMQLLSHTGEDGEQTNEIMAASQMLGVPVLAAMQLAKYKYPPTRVSGLPVMSDIEGSGKYFQNAEMVMLVYNEEIYGEKYAGEKWEPTHDSPGEARLILVKDKEGETIITTYMAWHARLAAYTSIGTFNLERERRGLM